MEIKTILAQKDDSKNIRDDLLTGMNSIGFSLCEIHTDFLSKEKDIVLIFRKP